MNIIKQSYHSEQNDKDVVLNDFYNCWQDEALVLDKWFAVQARNPSISVIDEIYVLLEHADFHLTNPNKVRAIVASFARDNLVNFHQINGEGYELVSNIIKRLNKLNPQVAARLTSSFNQWRSFEEPRRSFMEKHLQELVSLKDVSPDIYEIASKALV